MDIYEKINSGYYRSDTEYPKKTGKITEEIRDTMVGVTTDEEAKMRGKSMENENVIEEYQCPGCTNGSGSSCYSQESVGLGCKNHIPGTVLYPGGKIFLGMPKGFNKVGNIYNFKMYIYNNMPSEFNNNLNVPIWKYRNDLGHVFVRGLSPRINSPFLHVIINCSDNEFDALSCFEVTKSFLEKID